MSEESTDSNHPSQREPVNAADHIQRAKVTRYDHGGGRMWYEDAKGVRHLIADFYGDGEYREHILSMLGHPPQSDGAIETEAKQ